MTEKEDSQASARNEDGPINCARNEHLGKKEDALFAKMLRVIQPMVPDKEALNNRQRCSPFLQSKRTGSSPSQWLANSLMQSYRG